MFDEIVSLFGQGCSILAIKSFPLQLEVSFKDNLDKHNLNEWQKQMALSGLESATDSATASLTSYYESLGFECLNEDGVMFKIL